MRGAVSDEPGTRLFGLLGSCKLPVSGFDAQVSSCSDPLALSKDYSDTYRCCYIILSPGEPAHFLFPNSPRPPFPLLASHFTTFSFAADPSSPSLRFSPDFARLFYFPLIFSSSPSLLCYAPLWLIYAITLSPSIRVLSLFWRLVNSRLMINQILITACWKPHSLSWCMVMIVPPLLLESQQTHSFIFFFFLSPPCFPLCLPSLCKPFSFHFVLEVVWRHPPMKHTVICIFAHARKNT